VLKRSGGGSVELIINKTDIRPQSRHPCYRVYRVADQFFKVMKTRYC